MKKLIILSGVSGAGRSTVAMALEEMGFNVMENLPNQLIAPLLDLIAEDKSGKYNRSAVVVNIAQVEEMAKLTNQHPQIIPELVLLTAEEGELLTRYKLTRHVHPLQIDGKTLEEAIAIEFEIEKKVRERASIFIDTTGKTPTNLRKIIFNYFRNRKGINVTSISFLSFGFKHGLPLDADIVFDTRTVPNPYYINGLADRNGRHKEVVEYLERQAETEVLFQAMINYLDHYLPQVNEEARGFVTIAIGCSGGQHRSVYFAERLQKHYHENYRTFVSHRDVVRFRK